MERDSVTTVGHAIRRIRMSRGMSQRACAISCGMPPSMWGMVELGYGRHANPKLTTIMRMATVLGLTLAELDAEVARDDDVPQPMPVKPTVQGMILAAMHGPMTPLEVAAELPDSYCETDKVRWMLKHMVRRGMLQRVSVGVYAKVA